MKHDGKKMGRPPFPPGAVKSDKYVRAIRLGDKHWEVLKRRGTGWLERLLDLSEDMKNGK